MNTIDTDLVAVSGGFVMPYPCDPWPLPDWAGLLPGPRCYPDDPYPFPLPGPIWY